MSKNRRAGSDQRQADKSINVCGGSAWRNGERQRRRKSKQQKISYQRGSEKYLAKAMKGVTRRKMAKIIKAAKHRVMASSEKRRQRHVAAAKEIISKKRSQRKSGVSMKIMKTISNGVSGIGVSENNGKRNNHQ